MNKEKGLHSVMALETEIDSILEEITLIGNPETGVSTVEASVNYIVPYTQGTIPKFMIVYEITEK